MEDSIDAAGGPGARSTGAGSSGAGRAIIVAAYVMLFLAGIMQGVLGCFYYGSGPAPLAALGFDVLVLVSCLLAAWGMQRGAAGFVLAAGWFVATFVLAMGTTGGSVLVTDSTAGGWFLFGGSVSAAAGALGAFAWSSRR